MRLVWTNCLIKSGGTTNPSQKLTKALQTSKKVNKGKFYVRTTISPFLNCIIFRGITSLSWTTSISSQEIRFVSLINSRFFTSNIFLFVLPVESMPQLQQTITFPSPHSCKLVYSAELSIPLSEYEEVKPLPEFRPISETAADWAIGHLAFNCIHFKSPVCFCSLIHATTYIILA